VEAPDEETAQQWMDEREDDSAFHNEKLIDSVTHLAGVLVGDDKLPVDVIVDPVRGTLFRLRYDGVCASCEAGKFVQYELEDLP
jgi:hypothetical protein